MMKNSHLHTQPAAFRESRRMDLGLGLLLVALAAALRFWQLTSLGLTHFDEGSYAMTGRWLATFGREGWIFQSGHAPGLFPTLVGICFLLFGVHDYAAIGVSAGTGSLTAGVIYAIGRCWFNRATALLAALFLATAEYHLIYSRLALTDATFTLLFWASLGFLFLGLRENRRRWFISGGVLTGLCWNTKYHGFFPLLLVGAWLVVQAWYRFVRRQQPVIIAEHWRHLGLAAVLAGLLYLPWFLFVQFSVGYGAVLQSQLAHSFGQAALLVTPPRTLYFYLSHWLTPALLLAAVAGALDVLLRRDRSGLFLLLALLLFTAATLFYLSFPRLLLPVVPGVCLLAALGVQAPARLLRRRNHLLKAALATIMLVMNSRAALPVLALRTDGYRRAADYLAGVRLPVLTQMSKNFYFYENRPSFELRRRQPAALDSLLRQAGHAVLAVDPIVQRFPELVQWLAKWRPHLSRVHEIPLMMYEPVYYQGFDPTRLAHLPPVIAPFRPGGAKIEIYEWKNER
ncbi:MAG: phospholipid carrier-dependent glycosyltransferase [candidate division KSB1 bacterium]|nr:phospholipid carrier-dependent glycosyltransferase [candidate division KSB1 bacterium]MDZ7275892.1 phospholipid carrier-dependent glycosyltransferase [candidate division KSB1 bacterium]MDZ7287642.1 phospholipid carrier-dependent glycosyltransferase [candidate division KSB1 bacterium]MDZ7306804.1 phospholipid carrier-dependent glycosyltransferase [candidate division KSB1 bacterium]MDZ7350620.1 phospholipid carrier-dependent glycosyltransferase [candidate division KSB1 bacterium]